MNTRHRFALLAFAALIAAAAATYEAGEMKVKPRAPAEVPGAIR